MGQAENVIVINVPNNFHTITNNEQFDFDDVQLQNVEEIVNDNDNNK